MQLCQAAALTTKPSSAPSLVMAELMYGQWACRHLADGGITRTPEETILKAYDTMTGAEKPAFAKI